jgi:hypothetical protein
VGEIGIPPETFKKRLRMWEVRCIIRGYTRRQRSLWSATRWQTYHIMLAQIGTEGMRNAGINKTSDLMPFPWEVEAPIITEDEEARILAELEALNNSSSGN